MLSKISLLTAIGFVIAYPLCFWISAADPLTKNFHRFHIGLPAFVGGVMAVIVFFSQASALMKAVLLSWALILLAVTYINWKKEKVDPVMISVPCLWGSIGFMMIHPEILGFEIGVLAGIISILAGIILSAALYAMNLGHWYLNVHGLPIKHLRWAVNVFGAFLAVRLLFDAVALVSFQAVYDWEVMPLWKFTLTPDGFLLWLAIFFGVVFPLCSLYFVYGVLRLKNTQSTTGILYVVLSGVLIGDLTYKYYLVKYGIVL